MVILDHEFLNETGDDATDQKGDDRAPDGRFIPFEIIDHHDGGNGQQVQQVDTDGEPHHIEDEDDPSVGAGFVGILLPFEDGPEDEGGKKGRGGIDFAFDGAVPERIAESIGEGADDAGSHDGECLIAVGFSIGIVPQHDPAGKMGNGPEQEEDGQAAGDGAHEVDGTGGGMGVIAEEDDKKAAHQDEQRGAGGVGDLQLITAGDEFAAVPEAAGRFHGHDKYGAGNQSHDPAHDIVHSVEIHWYNYDIM